MNEIVEKYRKDIIKSFVEVCRDEGCVVNRKQLNFDEILDAVLSGCVSNMAECLDDEINNELLDLLSGVKYKEGE